MIEQDESNLSFFLIIRENFSIENLRFLRITMYICLCEKENTYLIATKEYLNKILVIQKNELSCLK